MDYIELADTVFKTDPTDPTRYIMGAVFALLGIWFICMVVQGEGGLMSTVPALGFVTGAILCFVLPVASDGPKPDLGAEAQHRMERAEQIQNEIADYYGLELTDQEIQYLSYPSTKPAEGFQDFGSFDRTGLTDDGGILKREITLVWKDGKMILAQSKDGENFTPLKPQSSLEDTEPSDSPTADSPSESPSASPSEATEEEVTRSPSPKPTQNEVEKEIEDAPSLERQDLKPLKDTLAELNDPRF